MGMTILESSHNLLEEPPRLVLCHLPTSHDVLEQLTREILDHHDNIGRRVDHIVAAASSSVSMTLWSDVWHDRQLYNVRMAQERKILNLGKKYKKLGGFEE